MHLIDEMDHVEGDETIRITVVDSLEGAGRDLSVEIDNFPHPHEMVQFTYEDDPAALVDACANADAILNSYAPMGREVLEQLTDCKVISVAATGWDCIDIAAAKELGISVCCIDEYCTGEVADHTLALILALNRKLFQYHKQVQEDKNWVWDGVTGIKRLSGQTLGIIGFGRIGKAVARRAEGFGLNVMVFDPYQKDYHAKVRLGELNELLRESDIITLHASLSRDNNRLIDGGAFLKMERKPLLINVARGALIDESELAYALDNGLVSGAALDVLADEPPDLDDHPLAGRDNVILTPHVAFYSDRSLLENRRISASNIRYFFESRPEKIFRFVHHAA